MSDCTKNPPSELQSEIDSCISSYTFDDCLENNGFQAALNNLDATQAAYDQCVQDWGWYAEYGACDTQEDDFNFAEEEVSNILNYCSSNLGLDAMTHCTFDACANWCIGEGKIPPYEPTGPYIGPPKGPGPYDVPGGIGGKGGNGGAGLTYSNARARVGLSSNARAAGVTR